MLDRLKQLRRGKVIKIDTGGKVLRFKVGKTEYLPLHPSEKKMAELLSHIGRPRMTVVTCLWNKFKRKYDKLLVKHAPMIS